MRGTCKADVGFYIKKKIFFDITLETLTDVNVSVLTRFRNTMVAAHSREMRRKM